MQKRLKQIAEKEAIKVDDGVYRQIAEQTNGDMRKAVTQLQMLSQTVEVSSQGIRELTVEHMEKMKKLQGIVTVNDSTEILQKIINT